MYLIKVLIVMIYVCKTFHFVIVIDVAVFAYPSHVRVDKNLFINKKYISFSYVQGTAK